MATELKATIVNLKSLNQNIVDPVVVGAGDANGRTLRIIFTQEAAAQLTEDTKVYLSWHHQEQNIKGYNVFTEITDEDDEDFPPTWEITYPRTMLYEGNVLACIQLVDSVSIATSTNFTIHVLIDPNDGSTYTVTDDFSEFQKAVINMATLSDKMKKQMVDQKLEFEDMQLEFMDVRNVVQEAKSAAEQAQEIAENALATSREALNLIVEATDVATEAQRIGQEVLNKQESTEAEIQELSERLDNTEQISVAVKEVADRCKEIAEEIANLEYGDVTDMELREAVEAAKAELEQEIADLRTDLESLLATEREQSENELLEAISITEF